jgi:hypothetical protein
MNRTATILIVTGLVCLALVGCNGEKKAAVAIENRQLPANVGGLALTPESMTKAYAEHGFVFASGDPKAGGTIIDDTSPRPANLALNDTRLIVLVEGSGDALEGFRYTGRLIAESRAAWQGEAAKLPLLVVPIHWSDTSNPVLEHMNFKAQRRGAGVLQDMLQVHMLRHQSTPGATVSILAFSAGTRVVQMAFGCQIKEGQITAADTGQRPPWAGYVVNIAFVGCSIARLDPVPFEGLRGRFVNFVNRRDTHFGDRAPFAAPPGAGPALEHMVSGKFLQRNPGFGASANGFDKLPTLTSAEQFDLVDSSPKGRQVFRMINFRVPAELLPYGLMGEALESDDLDDFINLAPNHYIMVGRGAGGMVSGPAFTQYREVAAEFVQNFVAAALFDGRVSVSGLTSQPVRITPLDILTSPITVPGKLVEPFLPGPKNAEQPKEEEKKDKKE